MEKSGSKVDVLDVTNFILNDETYPIKELNIEGLVAIEPDISQQSKQKIQNFLEQGKEFIKLALQKHKLFQNIMPGNPCIISRFAYELVSENP